MLKLQNRTFDNWDSSGRGWPFFFFCLWKASTVGSDTLKCGQLLSTNGMAIVVTMYNEPWHGVLECIWFSFIYASFSASSADQPLTRHWRNWIIAYPSPFEQLLPHLANFPFSRGTREQADLPLKFWGFSNCRWKILSATVLASYH